MTRRPANSSSRRRATIRSSPTALLIEELDLPGNQRRTHWKQSVPIASWLLHHRRSRDSRRTSPAPCDGIPIQTWVFPQDRDAGRQLFEDQSRRALLFFFIADRPVLRTRSSPTSRRPASPAAPNTRARSSTVRKASASGRGPVVHEIAHQWFGDSVTERDWDDVWLSEGFATYFALLFTEHDEGRDPGRQR